VPDLSSLPARIDPSDWLDEELPTIDHSGLDSDPGTPDFDGSALCYSPVAELDAVDVAERAGGTASPGANDDWDEELAGVITNPIDFRICQNKLNR
jgi:hypothetical protein